MCSFRSPALIVLSIIEIEKIATWPLAGLKEVESILLPPPLPSPPLQITDCFCTFASASYSGSDPECGCRRVLVSGRDGGVIVCQSWLCSVQVWTVGVCVCWMSAIVFIFVDSSLSLSLCQRQNQLSEILRCCCTFARGLLYPRRNKRTTEVLAKGVCAFMCTSLISPPGGDNSPAAFISLR